MLLFVLYLIEVLNEQVIQKYVVHTLFCLFLSPYVCKADSYGNEKLILRKWTKSVLFLFFSILWEREWSRFVSQIRLSVVVHTLFLFSFVPICV